MTSQLPTIDATLAHEDSLFARAVKAVVMAKPQELKQVLSEAPQLARSRSRSPHSATLLHYVTANAIEDALQLSPDQIYNQIQSLKGESREQAQLRAIEIAQILIESGCDVDALAEAYGGGPAQTPLNWLVSSGHPNQAGIGGQLTELFCNAGANLDGLEGNSSPVLTAIGFGHFQAANILFQKGCLVDNLLLAAAAGRVDMLEGFWRNGQFSTENLDRCTMSWFQPPGEPDRAAELALVFASLCGQVDAMRFLLNAGVNMDAVPKGTFMTAGPLHTAALVSQMDSVDFLINAGADPTVKEPRYGGDAFAWAREGNSPRIMEKVGNYYCKFLRTREASKPELKEFIEAVFSGELARVDAVLSRYSLSSGQLNGPWFHFEAPAIVHSKRNLPMVDRLVEAGANINQKSHWWAGGFGVLDDTEEELAEQLMARGAKLDAWSAASLNRLNQLKSLVEAEPKLVRARGPDGKTPLHCAGSVGVAAYLISKGADVNARCYDHESTPAQYLATSHPEIVRYLISQGCETDIMLAAALGDERLAEEVLQRDESVLRWEVSRDFFPSQAADCIYSWTLGWYLTPHQVARKQKHPKLLEWMMQHSDPATRFLNACLLGLEQEVEVVRESFPDVIEQLTAGQIRQVCHAARNNETQVVLRLLRNGFPVDARGQHEATVLHWAVFHGNLEMTRAAIACGASIEAIDGDFKATPLNWVCQGATQGWYKDSGDFLGCFRTLIEAGAKRSNPWEPIGHAEIDQWIMNQAT